MSESSTIRVAAAQFHIGHDLDENLQTCLRMIRKAAECQPDLIVLPEFCNHLSWYEDQAHCDQVAVTLDGRWLKEVAACVEEVGAFVVINCTIMRDDGACTGTSLLYSPAGELLGENDKQIYIGHENDFLRPAQQHGPIVDTPVGRIGMYACMDGVINEPPRALALRGAQIICNSVNSFAPDEGSLHMPVRAPENRVFMVAANKVGPLIPEFLMEPVSEATGIPPEFLCGAGDSQIVAPDGTVLAIAGNQEEVIFADIDPAQADNKIANDGTDIFASRRPDLYQPLAEDPASVPEIIYKGAENAKAAMVQLSKTGPDSLSEAINFVAAAVSEGADLIVLPELFFLADSASPDLEAAVNSSDNVVSQLSASAGTSIVSTSIVIEENGNYFHAAVAINSNGIIATQKQLHQSARLNWSSLGDEIVTLDTAFGRLGFVNGGDIIYPEMFRLVAMKGAEVVAVPFSVQESWELRTGLVERAAENRLNLVAVTQPSSLGTSFANKLHKDFTVLTPWQEREFDGNLTYPLMTKADSNAGVTLAELTPINAQDKVVSRGTDLIRNRPWKLADVITATTI